MAQKKISDLQLRSSFDSTCSVPVEDSTQTYRVTASQLKDYVSQERTQAKTSAYTPLLSDDTVLVDTSSSSVAITLPLASTMVGKIFTIGMSAGSRSNPVTIVRTSPDLIHNRTSIPIIEVGEFMMFQATSIGWVRISHSYREGSWVSHTITPPTGYTTNITWTSMRRRVQDMMEFRLHAAITGAIGTPGDMLITAAQILNGLTGMAIDTTKLPGSGLAAVGTHIMIDASIGRAGGTVNWDVTNSRLSFTGDGPNNNHYTDITGGTNPFTFASPDSMDIFVRLPIANWEG